MRASRRVLGRAHIVIAALLFGAMGTVVATPLHAQAGGRAGRVLGQVVVAATGQPLAGAVVQLGSRELETDDVGMFQFADVAAGRQRLRVTHLGYGAQAVEINVEPGGTSRVLLRVSETAITLAPLNVEALSLDSMRARSAGFARGVLTRAELAQWDHTSLTFGDVLRTAIPSVRMRRLERMAGSEVCIELRSIRAMNNDCLMPAVFLDGVRITNPTYFFAALEVASVDRVEIVPAAEAGVRFGSGALYGAILIDSRRPRVQRAATRPREQPNFDWSSDAHGHRTGVVLLSSGLGNLLGAAAGYAAARSCIHLRQPANDALQSSCGLALTLGTGVAAVALPALASGLATRWAGQTPDSRGLLAPAVVGSAMVIVPGYALALSGQRNQSQPLEIVGVALVTIGAPLAATAADYLFRKLLH